MINDGGGGGGGSIVLEPKHEISSGKKTATTCSWIASVAYTKPGCAVRRWERQESVVNGRNFAMCTFLVGVSRHDRTQTKPETSQKR